MQQKNGFALNRQTLPEQVAAKMESMILMDAPNFSGKLPSEQALSAMFATSRTVIREALVILRAKGLVVKSNGSCSQTVSNPTGNLEETLARVIRLRNIQPLEIYEIRLALEVLAAGLAAEKCTQEDIAELRALSQAVNDAIDDITRRAGLDIEFHTKIARIGGNPLLIVLTEAIFELLKPYICQAIKYVGCSQDATKLHNKLVDALEAQDAENARTVIQAHLVLSMRNVEMALKTGK